MEEAFLCWQNPSLCGEKNKRKKKNRKRDEFRNDEDGVASGIGAQNRRKRNRRKRGGNRMKARKNSMYWNKRRWKNEGEMPTDIKLLVDNDVAMGVKFDLQDLGLARSGSDIPVEVMVGSVDTASLPHGVKNKETTKGQSTGIATGNAAPQKVMITPVPKACSLAVGKYNQAVAELIRGDKILIKKLEELEQHAICMEDSGNYSPQGCLQAMKQVRSEVDRVMHGISGKRDEAKDEINRHCYQDDPNADGNPESRAAPQSDVGTLHHKYDGPITYKTSSEASSHAFNKDDEISTSSTSGHLAHEDDYDFSQGHQATIGQGRSVEPDNVDTFAPDRHVDGTITVESIGGVRSHPFHKDIPAASKPLAEDIDDHREEEEMVPDHLVDADRCKTATKAVMRHGNSISDIENLLRSELTKLHEMEPCKSDEESLKCEEAVAKVEAVVASSIKKEEKLLDAARKEKALYCSHEFIRN